jgi:SAM-dependent methyltransferase
MKPDTYIHGTEPAEQQRLALLNRLTNAAFVEFLDVQPGMRILEAGSGIGFLAAAVAQAARDVKVAGLERSEDQIKAAVQQPGVEYVLGDVHKLPFDSHSFDLVYARYVLEHVPDPQTVLEEMKRVARPGCRVVACENDESLIRWDPACPVFEGVWSAFQEYQRTLGGDSQIGRRLYGLFRSAGLNRIELSVQPEIHWSGSPGFEPWVRNIIGNIDSARRGLIDSGLCSDANIAAANAELGGLLQNDRASSVFIWNRAVGVA